MTTRCPEPERWVDYFAGELSPGDEESLEAHLMGCAACAEEAGRVRAIGDGVREMIPPLLTAASLERLRARGVRVVEHTLAPGELHDVDFPRDVDVLLFRLSGLALDHAAQVSFIMFAEATGEVLLPIDDAPFDRAGGELLVACQKHFAHLPAETVAEVRVRDAAGAESVARYTIHHHFGR